MSTLRLLVRSARLVLRNRPRDKETSPYRFIPTRLWWVPPGRQVSSGLVFLIEAQERSRARQPKG